MRKHLILRNADALIAELRTRAENRSRSLSAAPHTVQFPVNGTRQPSMAKVGEVQRQLEVETILNALNKTRWNRKRAATALGIDYKALLYKMKKLGIEGKNSPSSATASGPKNWVVEMPPPSAQTPVAP
jgi:DNA-binding NtrC family response regulator